jgi:hypothetical protein
VTNSGGTTGEGGEREDDENVAGREVWGNGGGRAAGNRLALQCGAAVVRSSSALHATTTEQVHGPILEIEGGGRDWWVTGVGDCSDFASPVLRLSHFFRSFLSSSTNWFPTTKALLPRSRSSPRHPHPSPTLR